MNNPVSDANQKCLFKKNFLCSENSRLISKLRIKNAAEYLLIIANPAPTKKTYSYLFSRVCVKRINE